MPPCAEKTEQRVSTCPGEGAEGHCRAPRALVPHRGRPEGSVLTETLTALL